MVKSIGSQNCELGHDARGFQGTGADTAFRCNASKVGVVDQINAYIACMRQAKICRVICDLIEQRERADAFSLAGFMAEKAPARPTT